MLKKYFILISIFLSSFAQQVEFKSKIVGSGFFDETTEIGCFIDDTQIGTIECTQLPFSFYILHSFFVGAAHRNKGYGRDLLSRACNHVDIRNPRTVLIQPGPFEMSNDGFTRVTEPDERESRLLRLCSLYEKAGFHKASKPVLLAAALLYKLIGLPEDAQYLMVK